MGVLAKGIGLCLLPAAAALAQENGPRIELTPFAAVAAGGGFEDMTSGESLDLRDDTAFGLILNLRHSPVTQWEFLYSRQATEARYTGNQAGTAPFEVDVHYLHAGGTYRGNGEYARPFLAATVGATLFEPRLSAVDGETFFSFSIGAGFQFRPNDKIGARLEARAFGTALASESDLFCQTGPDKNVCAIHADATVLWQFEALAGVVIRF